MASGAMRVEIGFSRHGITDCDAGDFVGEAQACIAIALMEKGNEVRDSTVPQIEPRHSFVGPAPTDDRTDQFSLLIMVHQHRAQQVRPGVAASGFLAMTERAVAAVEVLAPRYGRRILVWGQVRINARERLVDGSRVCGFGVVAFGSFFSCAADRVGQKIKIASNPHSMTSAKRSAIVFAELAWRFERKGFSLNMFNPSAEDFLGATSSSPPEGTFHIQPIRLLCNR